MIEIDRALISRRRLLIIRCDMKSRVDRVTNKLIIELTEIICLVVIRIKI